MENFEDIIIRNPEFEKRKKEVQEQKNIKYHKQEHFNKKLLQSSRIIFKDDEEDTSEKVNDLFLDNEINFDDLTHFPQLKGEENFSIIKHLQISSERRQSHLKKYPALHIKKDVKINGLDYDNMKIYSDLSDLISKKVHVQEDIFKDDDLVFNSDYIIQDRHSPVQDLEKSIEYETREDLAKYYYDLP